MAESGNNKMVAVTAISIGIAVMAVAIILSGALETLF